MSIFAKAAAFARSPQGKRALRKATEYARSPEGRKQLQRVIDTAKARRARAGKTARPKKRARS